MLLVDEMGRNGGRLVGGISHGQAIFPGHFSSDRLFPMLLTYCMPFSVAMYSQIQGKRQRDRLQAEISATAMQPAMRTPCDEWSDKRQRAVIRSAKRVWVHLQAFPLVSRS